MAGAEATGAADAIAVRFRARATGVADAIAVRFRARANADADAAPKYASCADSAEGAANSYWGGAGIIRSVSLCRRCVEAIIALLFEAQQRPVVQPPAMPFAVMAAPRHIRPTKGAYIAQPQNLPFIGGQAGYSRLGLRQAAFKRIYLFIK